MTCLCSSAHVLPWYLPFYTPALPHAIPRVGMTSPSLEVTLSVSSILSQTPFLPLKPFQYQPWHTSLANHTSPSFPLQMPVSCILLDPTPLLSCYSHSIHFTLFQALTIKMPFSDRPHLLSAMICFMLCPVMDTLLGIRT